MGIVVFGLLGVVLVVGFPALQFASTARLIRRQFTLSEEWATGFGVSAVRVESALAKRGTAYRAFDRMRVRGGVVLLRRKNSTLYSVIPAELVPTEAQKLFASHLRK